MIVHIITRLAMGGAQQLVFEVTKRLHNSKDRDVVIFTGLTDKKSSLSALDNNILDLVFQEGIKVEIIPFLNDRISLLNDFKSFIKIYTLLKKYKPSIVHIHSSKVGLLARIVCRLLEIKKVIYHVHGWSFSRSGQFSGRLFLMLEKFLYNFTKEYIFVCKQDMTDYINLGGNTQIKLKSNIIYPGADFMSSYQKKHYRTILRNELGFCDGDHVIGTIGRLDFQKNPEIFIEIAKKYLQTDNHAKFLWIGKGAYKNNLEKYINKLELSDKFRMTGYIEDVEPYYSVFDTFVITSRYEGLPVTILKALACGVPAVGFRINGINDLSNRFKMVHGVKAFHINDFVDKLAHAKKQSKMDKKTSESESNFIKNNFHLNKMYENIIEVYDSI